MLSEDGKFANMYVFTFSIPTQIIFDMDPYGQTFLNGVCMSIWASQIMSQMEIHGIQINKNGRVAISSTENIGKT